MEIKYVIIVQCDIAHNRCSGFACTQSFYNREFSFSNYSPDIQYLSFTCGGCCGKSVSAKFEHFANKLLKKTQLTKDNVAVHLSSCMTNDNHHYDRCPHLDYIKNIILKKGFVNLTEGSYLSKGAVAKRESGEYNSYV